MEDWFATNAGWLLPLVLLLLQFCAKLLINERASAERLWQEVMQSPVDVAFIAVSFVAASILDEPATSTGKVMTMILYMVAVFLAVAIWKFSPKGTTRRDLTTAASLTVLNFAFTGAMLVHAIALL